MNFSHSLNNKFKRLVWLCLASGLVSSCAFAPWDKTAVTGKTPEERSASAKKQLTKQPEAAIPRKDLLVTQDQAVTELLIEADKARNKGQFNEANALYERVKALAPNNVRAISGKEGIEREQQHMVRVEMARALNGIKHSDAALSILRAVLMESPKNAMALALQSEIRSQNPLPRIEPPKLKSPFQKPVTLEFRDVSVKMMFEALSRATGINFILDNEIKTEARATAFIKDAPIEEAIEMVLATNGLQKKALTETSALIFPNTMQKNRDYQEVMIRSFYLANASAKHVAETIKAVLKTKDVVVDDRLNMIVMRDTPEVIRIAEKLVAANDLADPEVMLDIEVLEVSRSRAQDVGIVFPNQISVITTPLTIQSLRSLTGASYGVSPNPALNFQKTTGDVNLISNPRIRVRNNEKAKVLVGDKVPIITTTSTANVGVSESVTYLDVGLKLDVQPRITLDDFVNIKIELEVSSLGEKTITRNGATVYTIGTRNASTLLRLKDGETQVLAGLILDTERKNTSRLPGMGDIPLLGRLFSDQADSKNKTEIILTITPRILGNISRPSAEIMEYWSGTEVLINDRPQISVPTIGVETIGSIHLEEPVSLEPLSAPVTGGETVGSVHQSEGESVEPKAGLGSDSQPTIVKPVVTLP